MLALYDETVAGLDQLPELERTILTRQYIEGEYQPTIRDELGIEGIGLLPATGQGKATPSGCIE